VKYMEFAFAVYDPRNRARSETLEPQLLIQLTVNLF